MLNDRPSLPSPRDWAIICARDFVAQGKTITQAESRAIGDSVEQRRHEARVVEEMRRLGAPE